MGGGGVVLTKLLCKAHRAAENPTKGNILNRRRESGQDRDRGPE